MYAQRSVTTASQRMNEASIKLSSGTRITKAADDASGLAISERLKSQVRSKGQALRNANDGLSIFQVADGALNEIGKLLIRMKEMSIQASTDTIDAGQRRILDQEHQQMLTEIDRISETTNFNGTKLLNGTSNRLNVQVDINNTNNDRMEFDTKILDARTNKIGISSTSLYTKDSAQKVIEKVDKAIQNLSKRKAIVGSNESRLISSFENLQVSKENLSKANSQIRDTDIAKQVAEKTSANIVKDAAVNTLANANTAPNIALKLVG